MKYIILLLVGSSLAIMMNLLFGYISAPFVGGLIAIIGIILDN